MNELLSFQHFSSVNRDRCESDTGFSHTMESWHPTQWTNALAGEAGEACNVTKKMLRIDQGIRGNKTQDTDYETLRLKAMREIADVIIYADLAIQALGGDTATVVTEVFNIKSAEIGSGCLL